MNQRVMQSGAIVAQVLDDRIHAYKHLGILACMCKVGQAGYVKRSW